jgi:hypothetical protein
MTKDPNAAAKQRQSEARSNAEGGLKSVSIPLSSSAAASSSGGPAKKKPVFKSTLQPQNAAVIPPSAGPTLASSGSGAPSIASAVNTAAVNEAMAKDWNLAVANGWDDDVYDPTKDDGEDGDEFEDVDMGQLAREFAEMDARRERAKRLQGGDRMEE